ncbi:MAG TPA: hypothetical protein VNG35_16495 [Gemmatimonadales bacterium]|nr:hypothetical protein [Gemmatimonadales bacterium]
MKQPPAALVAEWYAKAAASGFQDIEPGPRFVSTRGMPTRTSIIDTSAYYEQAKAADVSGLEPLDRTIWRLHADRLSIRDIASHMRRQLGGRRGGRFKRVRESILETRRALFGNQTRQEQGDQGEQCENQKPLRLLRRLDLDTQTLVELTALLTVRSRPRRCLLTSSRS